MINYENRLIIATLLLIVGIPFGLIVSGAYGGGLFGGIIILYLIGIIFSLILVFTIIQLLGEMRDSLVIVSQSLDKTDDESVEDRESDVDPETEANKLESLGDTAVKNKEYHEAIKYYGESLQFIPENSSIFEKLSLLYIAVGDLKKAEEYRIKAKRK